MNTRPPTQLNIPEALAIATAHHQSGRLAQAEQIYRQVLQQNPQQPEALNLLGVIACQHGRLEEGITLYRQALAIRPAYTGARENLCLALWKQGKSLIEEATNTYSQIVTFEPNNVQAFSSLGLLLQDQGKLDEALSYYQQALTADPNHPGTLNNIGVVLQQQGKPEQAIVFHQRALAAQPDYIETHISLGTALQEQGKMAEATACYDRALKLDPNHAQARYNRALMYLIAGDYGRGFPEYEWRFKAGEFAPCPFRQPLWDGSDLQGRTLLLHAEQGMGDTIQFIRYAEMVAQKGGRMVLTCHQPLIRLLSTIPGIEQLVPLSHPVPDFDTYAPLMSLPSILGTTMATLPAQPYLQAPPTSLRLTAPAATRLKVGIVWSGGNLYKRNHSRSCQLKQFQPILQVPQVAFYSLQKGIPQLDLLLLEWESQVQDLSGHLHDMAETAAAIAQLDLVITVDTAVAHLAGALGRPVWVLLSAVPDWRWMMEREDSPWYPSMRLFRQSEPGDWEGVMGRVAQALREL